MQELTTVSKTPARAFQRIAMIISIICFALVMSALLGAIISDIAIFAQQIVMFVVAVLGSVLVFILGFFLVIISCMLIFGIYLLEEYGFWPFNWASQTFSEIIKDAKFTDEQIAVLVGVRVFLLILCVFIFISAIIALIFASIAKKQNANKGIKIKQGLTKSFSILSIVFSTLGFFMALIVLLLVAVLATAL